MKNIIRLAALGLAVGVAGLGAAARVSAHAEYLSSLPADGETVTASPPAVTVTFKEEVQELPGSFGIAVTDSSGASVTNGAASVGATKVAISIPLRAHLPAGDYTVAWNNTSADDGDAEEGEFVFHIGAATSPGPVSTPAPAAAHTHDEPGHAADPGVSGAAAPPTVGLLVATIQPQNSSAVGGRIELIPAIGGDATQVGVYLSGLAPGTSHVAHVHVASTCFEGAHAADLDTITASSAGYGRSITVVDVPFSMLADGNHVILVHAGADDSSAANEQVIACGIIPKQPAAPIGAAQLPSALPSTGVAGSASNTFAIFMTLAAVALAGTLIAAGGITVRNAVRE